MTTLRRHMTMCAAILIASSFILSACASTREPATKPGQAVSPVESPSPTAESMPAPQPVFDLDCEQLLPDGVGAQVLGTALPAPVAVTPEYEAVAVSPIAFATRQTGGLYCESSNGEPFAVDTRLNPDYVGVHIRIVAGGGATEGWTEFVDFSASTEQPLRTCAVGLLASCDIDTVVNDAWVTASFYGLDEATIPPLDVPAEVRAVFDGMTQRLSGAETTSLRWSQPSGTAALDRDCEQFFTRDDLAAQFGITEETFFGPYEDYATSERAARLLAPALACPWATESNHSGSFGAHSWLQGGEWAFNEVVASGSVDEYEPIAVAGLSGEDRAMISCEADGTPCVLHLVAAHDWIIFYTDPTMVEISPIQVRETMISLAEQTVATIRG